MLKEGALVATTSSSKVGLLRQFTCLVSLVISDILTFIIALQLAILIRNEVLVRLFPGLPPPSFALQHYLRFWWMPVILFFFLGVEGLYNHRRTFWDEVQALSKAVTLASVTIFAIVALGRLSPWISRFTLVVNWAFLLLLMPLSRLLVKRFLFRLGLWRRDILILGAARTGQLALKAFNQEPLMGYRVVGFLDDDPDKQGALMGNNCGEPVRVIGTLAQAQGLIEEGLAKDVIVAMPGMPEEGLLDLVGSLQRISDSVRVIPNTWSLPMMSLKVDHFLRDRTFTVTIPYNLANPWKRWLKRVFDILVAGGLILLALPLMILIALAIKLTSRGPIIYKRKQLGQRGKFLKWKFRTMYTNADQVLRELLEKYPKLKEEFERHYKLQNDPRTTKVGKLLRKLSLDELPQLFNVLGGTMSLIGPRPIWTEELEKYYKDHAEWYFSVKPGITGLWQVSGKSDLDFNDRVALDVWYIRNWSLWLDLIILIRTVKTVLKREGAY